MIVELALIDQADGFALGMIATLILSFGVLIGLGLAMFWKVKRRDPEVDALLDEVREDFRREQEQAKLGPPEKKEDWWRE
jgi:hypothetical protein